MASPLTGQLGVAALGRLELGAWHPWLIQSHHDRARSAVTGDTADSGLSAGAAVSSVTGTGPRGTMTGRGPRSSISAGTARGGVG